MAPPQIINGSGQGGSQSRKASDTRTATAGAVKARKGPEKTGRTSRAKTPKGVATKSDTAPKAAELPSCPAVSEAEFTALATATGLTLPLAVAVSGGGDSMALLYLVARWANQMTRHYPDSVSHGWDFGTFSPVTVLTVDHGLRPEAADEAKWVADQAKQLSLRHVVLRHEGNTPQSNIQAQARDIRYGLLEGWCRENGVPTLLTGHTLDDQAETVLMRLTRGSGVDGLSGIAPRTILKDPGGRGSVEVLRPLLIMPRARLRATLETAGRAWLEDPSNDDDRFTRVRIRHLLEGLVAEGLDAERLAATAQRLQRARRALDTSAQDLMSDAVVWHEAGFAWIDRARLARAPEEIALRVLRQVLKTVGGLDYPPRHDRLIRLADMLLSDTEMRVRTLGSCRVGPLADGVTALITRETRHPGAPVALEPGDVSVWDERFQVSLPWDSHSGGVQALGQEGVLALKRQGILVQETLPVACGPSLPSLWCGDQLMAVPHLGYDPADTGFQAVFLTPRSGVSGHLDAFSDHRD